MTTVLLLDDNPDMLNVLAQVLEWGGYDIVTGRNGVEAIEYLERTSSLPAVIVSDLTMPNMNGAELLQTIRDTPGWAQIPFVIMSAQGALDDTEIADADAYLIKPFQLDQFQQVLHRWLITPDG
jgi:CheY-like chemotaxis protein